MNLLAIDTTTDRCAVAAHSESGTIEHNRYAPRLHNRHVLTMVDEVLRAAGMTPRDIGAIAFGAGPGSFTGVRIGAAVSQGIALAAGAGLIRVANSAVAAETLRTTSSRRGEVVIRRVSRPGWEYRARYRLDEDGSRCIAFDRLVAADEPASEDAVDGDRFAVSARIVAALGTRSLGARGGRRVRRALLRRGRQPLAP